jgi:hypothetical protein
MARKKTQKQLTNAVRRLVTAGRGTTKTPKPSATWTHPATYIDKRSAEISQTLAVLDCAVQGIVKLEDHTELQDRRESLTIALYEMFDAMYTNLKEIDACTDRLRETGVKPVYQLVRDSGILETIMTTRPALGGSNQ